jgi:5-formyltetrahydrofolate cyclo-ligase
MNVEKRALRQRLRIQRRSLSATRVEEAGAAVAVQVRDLPAYRAAAAVIAYVAHENEVPTAPLFTEIFQSGRTLLLPSQRRADRLVRWLPGVPLVPGPGGVLEPEHGETGAPTPPAVALVPVVGWDKRGTRLGRGGGYYDRLLAELDPEITRIGLAYAFQEVPELPRDPWDVPLHYVITERCVVRCSSSDAAEHAALRKGGMQR